MLSRWAVLAAALALAGCSAPAQVHPSVAVPAHVEPFALDVGGQTASGFLGVPADAAPRTLLVIAHPWQARAEDYRADLDRYARQGILAVAMDFRGDPLDFKVRAGVEDTVAATLALKAAHPSIDRTMVYGYSLGGEVALLAAATAPPGTYDYVFDGAGVADLQSLWASFQAARPAIEKETGGTPAEKPDEYRARSPALRAADLEGKGLARVYVVHAVGDAIVEHGQSERLFDALRDAGIPVSLYAVTLDQSAWVCVPVVTLCLAQAPTAPANHESGALPWMEPFLQHRIARLPDPEDPAVRGSYDGSTGAYWPDDVGN